MNQRQLEELDALINLCPRCKALALAAIAAPVPMSRSAAARRERAVVPDGETRKE